MSCITEVVPRDVASRLHLLMAAHAGRNQDQEGAESAFRGVLALTPGFEPDHDFAAPGSMLRDAWAAAAKAGVSLAERLGEGAWIVDGKPSGRTVPTDRNTVVHLMGDEFKTWYVEGGTLPATLAAHKLPSGRSSLADARAPDLQSVSRPPAPPPASSAAAAPSSSSQAAGRSSRISPQSKGHPSRNLAIGAGASAAASIGMYLLSQSYADAFWTAPDHDIARTRYNTANGLGVGSSVLGVASAGLITVAVVKGEW